MMQGQLWAHLLLREGRKHRLRDLSVTHHRLCSFLRQLRKVSGLISPTFPHKDEENQKGLRPFPSLNYDLLGNASPRIIPV